MAEVTLHNITKSFSGQVALADLSLTVPDGAFVVLLGPTGAGKTTTLRMVSGLDQPDGGEVDVQACSVAWRGAARPKKHACVGAHRARGHTGCRWATTPTKPNSWILGKFPNVRDSALHNYQTNYCNYCNIYCILHPGILLIFHAFLGHEKNT